MQDYMGSDTRHTIGISDDHLDFGRTIWILNAPHHWDFERIAPLGFWTRRWDLGQAIEILDAPWKILDALIEPAKRNEANSDNALCPSWNHRPSPQHEDHIRTLAWGRNAALGERTPVIRWTRHGI